MSSIGISKLTPLKSLYPGPLKLKIQQLGVTAFPRLVLQKNQNSSISAGMPVTAGISWANSVIDYSDGAGAFILVAYNNVRKDIHFAFEVPVVVDYNIGLGSSPENKSGTGLYLGIGYAYNYTSYSDGIYSVPVNIFEPLVRGGFRFYALRQQKFTIGVSFRRDSQLGLQILKDL